MRTRSLRAVRAALMAVLASFMLSAVPARAQQSSASTTAPAPAAEPVGPRVPPVMRQAEPDYANAPYFAPKKKEEMTTITISTVALVLLLILIIVLVA
jgi:hypothetical protein